MLLNISKADDYLNLVEEFYYARTHSTWVTQEHQGRSESAAESQYLRSAMICIWRWLHCLEESWYLSLCTIWHKYLSSLLLYIMNPLILILPVSCARTTQTSSPGQALFAAAHAPAVPPNPLDISYICIYDRHGDRKTILSSLIESSITSKSKSHEVSLYWCLKTTFSTFYSKQDEQDGPGNAYRIFF